MRRIKYFFRLIFRVAWLPFRMFAWLILGRLDDRAWRTEKLRIRFSWKFFLRANQWGKSNE